MSSSARTRPAQALPTANGAERIRSLQPTPGARSEARYHPSGEIAFPPAQTDPSLRSRGRIGNVNCLTRMAASVPDRRSLLSTPTRYKCGRIYKQPENARLHQNSAEKAVVIQLV